MKLSSRSFPHPVVGNRDDVPGAAFQATIEMSSDKEFIYIDVQVKCSSMTICNLISDGKAKYVLHVECSNTIFRSAFEFTAETARIAIPCVSLNDSVEVNAFVFATQNISGYTIEESHPDYGDATFEISKGDILAIAEGVLFNIESSYDSLSKVGSIMQIEESSKDGDHAVDVMYDTEKIMIILSKQDFKSYKLLKNQEVLIGCLTSTIVLPVLVEALYLLNSEYNDDDDAPKWARMLKRRISDLGLDKEIDKFKIAQMLLELPVRRALSASLQLASTEL